MGPRPLEHTTLLRYGTFLLMTTMVVKVTQCVRMTTCSAMSMPRRSCIAVFHLLTLSKMVPPAPTARPAVATQTPQRPLMAHG